MSFSPHQTAGCQCTQFSPHQWYTLQSTWVIMYHSLPQSVISDPLPTSYLIQTFNIAHKPITVPCVKRFFWLTMHFIWLDGWELFTFGGHLVKKWKMPYLNSNVWMSVHLKEPKRMGNVNGLIYYDAFRSVHTYLLVIFNSSQPSSLCSDSTFHYILNAKFYFWVLWEIVVGCSYKPTCPGSSRHTIKQDCSVKGHRRKKILWLHLINAIFHFMQNSWNNTPNSSEKCWSVGGSIQVHATGSVYRFMLDNPPLNPIWKGKVMLVYWERTDVSSHNVVVFRDQGTSI